MKITKTKLVAVSFGAAMTSLYSAPELSAQITDINFSPSTVPLNSMTYKYDFNLNAVQFTNINMGSYGILGNYGGVAAVGVFNNLDVVEIVPGSPFFGNGPGGPNGSSFNGGLQSQLALVEPGDFFANGTTGRISFEATSTGVRYIGFVAGGAVGWFSIDLGDTPGDEVTFVGGQFDIGGTLNGTVPFPGILVGNPSAPLLGDVNLDGEVNFLDISPFIGRLSTSEFQLEADINADGEVDFLDITPFIALLSGGSAPQVTWSDSSGKPLQLLANGNKVIEQQVQAMELKLTNELNAALAQANGSVVSATNEPAPASVGLAALALGAAGLRRRRKATATVA